MRTHDPPAPRGASVFRDLDGVRVSLSVPAWRHLHSLITSATFASMGLGIALGGWLAAALQGLPAAILRPAPFFGMAVVVQLGVGGLALWGSWRLGTWALDWLTYRAATVIVASSQGITLRRGRRPVRRWAWNEVAHIEAAKLSLVDGTVVSLAPWRSEALARWLTETIQGARSHHPGGDVSAVPASLAALREPS